MRLRRSGDLRLERALDNEAMPTAEAHTVVATPGQSANGEHRNRLAAAFDALERLPALAEPRNRLLESLRGPHPAQNEIVALIESDPGLTIAVLTMASRSRRSAKPVTDVRDAVAVLPLQGVAFLATRVEGVGFFERAGTWGGLAQRFRIHAITTQAAADRLATKVGYQHRGRLRTSALLHDIGKLVLAYAFSEYPGVVTGRDGNPEARLARERRQLGIDHAAVGAVAARRLGLPAGVASAINEHHDPGGGTEARIVRLADALAHYWNGDEVDPGQLTELGGSIGLSPECLTSFICDLPDAPRGLARFAEPSPLSRRQHDVLRLLAEGKQYKVIAAELGLATSTIRTHLHNLYGKMEVSDRAQAVLSASKRGWL
jgi:putative nucleotidyltransferase with HDIG domain